MCLTCHILVFLFNRSIADSVTFIYNSIPPPHVLLSSPTMHTVYMEHLFSCVESVHEAVHAAPYKRLLQETCGKFWYILQKPCIQPHNLANVQEKWPQSCDILQESWPPTQASILHMRDACKSTYSLMHNLANVQEKWPQSCKILPESWLPTSFLQEPYARSLVSDIDSGISIMQHSHIVGHAHTPKLCTVWYIIIFTLTHPCLF